MDRFAARGFHRALPKLNVEGSDPFGRSTVLTLATAAIAVGVIAFAIWHARPRSSEPAVPSPPPPMQRSELPFEVTLRKHPAMRMEWTGDSRASVIQRGLNSDEARFYGRWDYWDHGITIHESHTFIYWSRPLDGTQQYSQGTWTVHGERIALQHASVGGTPLVKPITTEHPFAEFGLPR